MAIIRAQVEIQSASGMPTDVVMNRFHFRTPLTPASGAEQLNILDRIVNFYDGTLTNTRKLSARWPVTVAANGHLIKLYDMADPKPRVPVFTGVFNLGVVPNQTGLPDEVALVLSFQATRVSGTAQARRRNRIYFGPIITSSATTVASETRPNALIIDDLIKAADEKLAVATLGIEWIVRSETTGQVAPVVDGWVDNSFDTQRRRGPNASARTVFTA
jgi:hypothetical protein